MNLVIGCFIIGQMNHHKSYLATTYAFITLYVISALLPPYAIAANPEFLPEYSLEYNASRDPVKDGVAALNLAKQTNRKVIIEVGGNWCAWCHRLDKFLHSNPQLRQDFFNTFVLVKVNVSEENDNQAFLSVFPPANGYPHMYVTDHNGNILESKDTADFLDNKRYSVSKFYDFINQWMSK